MAMIVPITSGCRHWVMCRSLFWMMPQPFEPSSTCWCIVNGCSACQYNRCTATISMLPSQTEDMNLLSISFCHNNVLVRCDIGRASAQDGVDNLDISERDLADGRGKNSCDGRVYWVDYSSDAKNGRAVSQAFVPDS